MTKEQLVEKLGIQTLDQEAQDRMLQEVANTVSTRIMAKLSEQLNEDDLEELSKLIDAEQDDQIEAYIYKKMPDYDNFKAQIEKETIDQLAANMDSIKAKSESYGQDQIGE